MSENRDNPCPHKKINPLVWYEREVPPVTLKEGQIDAGTLTVLAVDMSKKYQVPNAAIYTARRRHSKTNRVIGWNRDDFTHWAYFNLPGENRQRVDD